MALYKKPSRIEYCRLPLLNKVDFLLQIVRRFGQEKITLYVTTLHTAEMSKWLPKIDKTIEVGYMLQNLFTAHATGLASWALLADNDDYEETEYLLDAIFAGIDGVWDYDVLDDEIIVYKHLAEQK